MKVLIVGAGGRCHAIALALSKSKYVSEIYCAPGNAGIAQIATLVPIKETDVEALKAFAIKQKIDLTVVGPEMALAAGIVDEFNAAGLKIFGPTKKAAEIETSKSYAKDLMKKYHIPTASYEVFTDYEKGRNWHECRFGVECTERKRSYDRKRLEKSNQTERQTNFRCFRLVVP